LLTGPWNNEALLAVSSLCPAEKAGKEGVSMMFQVLFVALCGVIAANMLVVVIALTNAYRDEKKRGRFSGFAPN
jgi:hypothetical protein